MTTDTSNENTKGKKPIYAAYTKREAAKKYPASIGAAWENSDDINIRLDSIPLDGVVVLKKIIYNTKD